jgi:hypothetical protein
MTNYENIPAELRQPALWLQYYLSPDPKKPNKKPRKHPEVAYATDEDKSRNLKSLDYLIENRRLRKGGGYQRYIDPQEGFVYIDLDHVRNPQTGELLAWAQAIVDCLNTYTEVSASGEGLHLVARAKLPRDFKVETNPVEIYGGHTSNKLLALTGSVVDLQLSILDRQAELELLLQRAENGEFGPGKSSDTKSVDKFEEELQIGCIDDVEEQRIEWLWPDRIPLSAVTNYTGNPDTGKTLAYCDLIARFTTARDFPDCKMPQDVGGEVLLLCAKDDFARVIKPRLMACGANTTSIFYVEKIEIRQGAKRDERMFALDVDLSKLEAELEKNPLCSLIIIDPISSYFGKGNMNNKQDVRAVFNRLKVMCERFRIAIVAVEHFNKRVDVSAIHKMGGSVAMVAAARAAFMFAKIPDEEDQYVMHFIKGNLARRKVGLRYTIADKPVGQLGSVPYLAWGEEDTGTADDLLKAEKGTNENNRAGRAEKFLRDFLTEEKSSDEVMAEAKKRGISRNALYDVKSDLGIQAKKRGGVWYWRPETTATGEQLPIG